VNRKPKDDNGFDIREQPQFTGSGADSWAA
jgi:hypothetical protein